MKKLMIALAVVLATGVDPVWGELKFEHVRVGSCDEGGGTCRPFTVVITDLDHDGFPELIIVNDRPGGSRPDLVTLTRSLAGEWALDFEIDLDGDFATVAAADLDGDGNQDLGVSGGGSVDPVASVLLGDGDGGFLAERQFPAGVRPFGITIADLNGDTIPDLAVADRSDRAIVLLGNGDGTFWDFEEFPTGDNSNRLTSGDFNHDDVEDLVLANTRSDDVSVLLGKGDGTFEQETRYGTGDGPVDVKVGDFDGDGNPDLAVANFGTNDVSILTGGPGGTFDPGVSLGAGNNPESLAIADFDLDGHQDIVVANCSGDDVSVLLGQGDATFLPELRFGVGREPCSVAVGDLNGDGRPDIAAANFRSNDISLLLSVGPVDLLESLIDRVRSLNLHHGTENSLLAKLDAALLILTDVSEDNDHAAANVLDAFINQVEAQHGKKIADADADGLIGDAQAIIEVLEEAE